MTPTLLLLVFVAVAGVACVDDRPVIGLLTQPVSEEAFDESLGGGVGLPGAKPSKVTITGKPPGKYYVPASYVKFIESSGARVVPIKFDISKEELTTLFSSLNGVLFPGGGQSLAPGTAYRNLTTWIYDLVAETANTENPVPLWGTCLGFETVAVIAADDQKVLTPFDSENLNRPLRVNGECLNANSGNCRMLSGTSTPSDILSDLQNNPNITFNNHQYGVGEDTFHNNPTLSSKYRIVATSTDRKGKTFVSAMEAKDLPIYAVQFHPEKTIFEWNLREVIPHFRDAVMSNMWFSRFLDNQARQNSHQFPSNSAIMNALIYNYQPVYTGLKVPYLHDFEQCYFFD